MEFVFDLPMIAHEDEQFRRVGLVGRKTRDAVDHFDGGLSLDATLSTQFEALDESRPFLL